VNLQNHINRKKILISWYDKYNFKFCKPVKSLYIGSDKNFINLWSTIATSLGWEGIMVNLDKPYVRKRTYYLLKVKKMNTIDLRVIKIIEGNGKYKNMLGKVIVLYKGNEVGVGSGFTDIQRKEVFNNQNKYIGKIIEIQYFEISKNSKTNLESLRFPIFKMFRDKTEESYY